MEAVSKSARAGLKFPVSRFQRYLRKGNYADRIGTAAAVYMSAVLEYLTAEILELSGNAAHDNNRLRITPRHVMLAIKNDSELNELLSGAFFAGSGVMPNINPVLLAKKSKKGAKNDSVDGDDDVEPLSSQIY